MTLTGQLGTSASQPGNVQLGYAPTGTLVWCGPFAPAELTNLPAGASGLLQEQGQITLPLAVAQDIAASNPSWWQLH